MKSIPPPKCTNPQGTPLTMIQIAETLRICKETYSEWELGKSVPSLASVYTLSHILGVDVSEISDLEVACLSEHYTRQLKFESAYHIPMYRTAPLKNAFRKSHRTGKILKRAIKESSTTELTAEEREILDYIPNDEETETFLKVAKNLLGERFAGCIRKVQKPRHDDKLIRGILLQRIIFDAIGKRETNPKNRR